MTAMTQCTMSMSTDATAQAIGRAGVRKQNVPRLLGVRVSVGVGIRVRVSVSVRVRVGTGITVVMSMLAKTGFCAGDHNVEKHGNVEHSNSFKHKFSGGANPQPQP